jgi:UDP-N-acetylmuramate: L-alanyl-gamma-D-glutamyl-meso-diaminopimelate ligase
VHYLPRTLILNNLEFDHADIFEDLNAIKKQFHHLIRTVPQSGKVIWPKDDQALSDVITQGLWSESETLGIDWNYELIKADGSEFKVFLNNEKQGTVNWQAMGEHNVKNAIMAIAAARHVGIAVEHSIAALGEFISPKRRMELKADINNIKVYDDFAHHPTAIQTTLAGLRAKVGSDKIIAILEPRSNTMKMGVHQHTLLASLGDADEVLLFEPENLSWSLSEQAATAGMQCFTSTQVIIDTVLDNIAANQHILIMSNGSFNGLHQQLVDALANKYSGE